MWEDGGAAVEPDAEGEEEPEFFAELEKPCAGAAGGGDEDFGVEEPACEGVFIVEGGFVIGSGGGAGGVGGVRFVEFVVAPELDVVGNVLGQGLARGE